MNAVELIIQRGCVKWIYWKSHNNPQKQPPEVFCKKNLCLKISQISQEITCVSVSYLIKLQAFTKVAQVKRKIPLTNLSPTQTNHKNSCKNENLRDKKQKLLCKNHFTSFAPQVSLAKGVRLSYWRRNLIWAVVADHWPVKHSKVGESCSRGVWGPL